MQRVHHVTGTLVELSRDRNRRIAIPRGGEAGDAIARQHVEHEKFIVAITVDVGKIDAHGKDARLAHGELLDSAEFSATLVDPDFVRRIEIVTERPQPSGARISALPSSSRKLPSL